MLTAKEIKNQIEDEEKLFILITTVKNHPSVICQTEMITESDLNLFLDRIDQGEDMTYLFYRDEKLFEVEITGYHIQEIK